LTFNLFPYGVRIYLNDLEKIFFLNVRVDIDNIESIKIPDIKMFKDVKIGNVLDFK